MKIKSKIMRFLTSISLVLALVVTGCGSTSENSSSSNSSEGSSESSSEVSVSSAEDTDTVYGEITSVDGNTITMTVGELDDSGSLTLGDEVLEFEVTDSTEYTMGGMSSGGSGGPGGDMNASGGSEADNSGASGNVNTDGAINISDGIATVSDGYTELQDNVSEEDGKVTIDGLTLSDGSYGFTGISASDSDVWIKNSEITLDVDDAVDGSETPGTAIYADSGNVSVEDSVLTVNGAGRYTLAATGSTTMIVNDSSVIAGGDEGADGNTEAISDPTSNGALLISGNSRSNFSVGATHTYYYNSLCAADGWAALSTDSATGTGLELVAYNTEALALHGGYATYADTNCRDYLYGVNFISAEVGAIISNNGSITIGSAANAESAETSDGNKILTGLTGEKVSDEGRSVVIAGRNDFQLHSPDMNSEGNSDYSAQLSISDSDLITDSSINGAGYEFTSSIDGNTYTIQATTDYAETYGDAIGAYVDYVTGAAILIKSTSADITLDNVTITPSDGIAIMSVLNSDSMSRYLKQDVGNGVNIDITDSTIDGDLAHNDYQRDMVINVSSSTINGAVTAMNAEDWNAEWSDYSDDENCSWILDGANYVTASHATELTLSDGSTWNAQGVSTLTRLVVSSDSTVNGTIKAEQTTEKEDGSIEYTNAVVTDSSSDGTEAYEKLIADNTSDNEGSIEDAVSDASTENTDAQGGPGGDGNEPPEMPSGDMGSGGPGGNGGNGGEPPEKPDGDMGSGGPGGNMEPSLEMLAEGTQIGVLLDENGNAESVTILMGSMGGPGGDMGSGGPGGSGGGNGNSGSSGGTASGQIGSWSGGGTDASSTAGDDYAYDAALYITSDGIDEEKSSTDRIDGGTYDAASADGITISDDEAGHNGILVLDAEYSIKNATIDLLTDADGSETCDFSGKGTAITAFGTGANVTVDGSEIHTSGVATMPLFADDGATVTVKNSTMQSDGGTLYAEYMNTPDQGLMVAPPWILGIMGTSRCSNMMGNDTTTNVIDCETGAGAWAVLSTDAGSDMYLNIYNTSLTLNNTDESKYLLQEEGGEISETLDNPYTENYGSGYGTYAIGDAVETFAGATVNVGTYATIFTGGSAIYTNIEKGKTYELKNSAGDTTYEYTAEEDKVTTINSDTFGFMAHQSTNSIVIEKGTVVNTGYATFLVKSGASNETLTATVDSAEISNGGVLIQVLDNDDATNGGMMSTDDEANTNGGSQNFNITHTEDAGFKTGSVSADSSVQMFTFTNGDYTGNIYNSSGSEGLDATTLNVTLGTGAVLSGAAASASSIHVTYDGSCAVKDGGGYAFDDETEAAAFADKYQNTEFTINEYFSIGQVANLVSDRGGNAVNISLTDDAVWNVTGTSLITSLTIKGDAKVIIPSGITLTVNGTEYTDCTLTAADM